MEARSATAFSTVIYLLTWTCIFQIESTDVKRQIHHGPGPNAHHGHTVQSPAGAAHAMDNWLADAARTKPNVLFIIADDLRPKLGCYLDTVMVTPNIDNLASKSVMFKRAYAQVALCSPSRASFLTGRRADATRVYDLHTYWRQSGGNFTTLPQYFKNHGYFSQGAGKIFHPGAASGNNDIKYSWSGNYFDGSSENPFKDPHVSHQRAMRPVDESATGKLQDTAIADFAVNFLRERKATHAHQPFFLAVGFHKPHLPWIFPKQFLDLYPLSKIRLAAHRTKPPSVPDLAWSTVAEVDTYADVAALNLTVPEQVLPDDMQKRLRQAYSAAVSYLDHNVGRVMQALQHNGFADNTVVAFIGDHGWHLGDNQEWSKHTNYEMALRVPMTLYVPGVTAVHPNFAHVDATAPGFKPHPHGPGPLHSTPALVEAVDLFPTLAQLAGLPVPQTCPQDSRQTHVCVEGTSLVPLVKQVRNHGGNTSFVPVWKQAAFSQYARNNHSPTNGVMGYSVRTDRHRYTEWVHFDFHTGKPDFSRTVARELYDHSVDKTEFNNVADDAAHKTKVDEMAALVRGGWRQAQQSYLAKLNG